MYIIAFGCIFDLLVLLVVVVSKRIFYKSQPSLNWILVLEVSNLSFCEKNFTRPRNALFVEYCTHDNINCCCCCIRRS